MNSLRSCVLLLAATLMGLAPGCGREMTMEPVKPATPNSATLQVAGRAVEVELAFDDSARNRGLMHRTDMADDHGMLFLFVDDAPRLFWMRDTLIPLDICFLDAEGVLLNVEAAAAGVERPGFHSRGNARFVLELNLGWADQNGLKPGTRIEISDELRALAQP